MEVVEPPVLLVEVMFQFKNRDGCMADEIMTILPVVISAISATAAAGGLIFNGYSSLQNTKSRYV